MSALLVKFAIAFGILAVFNGLRFDSTFHTIESGDTMTYLQPAENLITSGVWAIDPGDKTTYARRPPLYGLIYLPFRALADRPAAELLLVALQLTVSALASIFFAKSVKRISGSERAALIAFVFHLLSIQLMNYDLRLLTESFAISLSIAVNYLFIKDGFRSAKISLIAGVLLAAVVFLRPFLGVIFPVLLWVLWRIQRRNFRDIFRHGAALLLPFIAASLFWSGFNYIRLNGEVILFQSSVRSIYLGGYRPYSRFLASWGGDNTFWNYGSAAAWFEGLPHGDAHQFPPVVFKDVTYTIETLRSARKLMVDSGLALGSTSYAAAAEILNDCADEYRRAHPVDSLFMAPWRIFWRYLRFIQIDTIPDSRRYLRSSQFRTIADCGALALNFLFFLGLGARALFADDEKTRFAPAYWAAALAAAAHLILISAVFRAPEGRYGVVTLWTVYPWGFWAIQRLLGLAKAGGLTYWARRTA